MNRASDSQNEQHEHGRRPTRWYERVFQTLMFLIPLSVVAGILFLAVVTSPDKPEETFEAVTLRLDDGGFVESSSRRQLLVALESDQKDR